MFDIGVSEIEKVASDFNLDTEIAGGFFKSRFETMDRAFQLWLGEEQNDNLISAALGVFEEVIWQLC